MTDTEKAKAVFDAMNRCPACGHRLSRHRKELQGLTWTCYGSQTCYCSALGTLTDSERRLDGIKRTQAAIATPLIWFHDEY